MLSHVERLTGHVVSSVKADSSGCLKYEGRHAILSQV